MFATTTTDIADGIAIKIADVLIAAFKVKESREPTSEEVQDLFDELTEERVAEMLGLPTSDENEVDKNVDSTDDASVEGSEEENQASDVVKGSEKLEENTVPEVSAKVDDINKTTSQKRKIDVILPPN